MWQALIKKLKDHGYTGEANDLAAVKSYIAEHFGGQIVNKGKSLDLDAEYKAAYPAKPELDITDDVRDEEVRKLREELEVAKTTNELSGANRKADSVHAVDIKVGKTPLADDPHMGYGNGPRAQAEFIQDVLKAGGNASGAGRPEKGSKLELFQKASLSTYANENTGADGGFNVMPEVNANINTRVMADDGLLARCDRVTIGGNSYTETRDETTPWGSSGIQAEWEGEAGTLSQTKPVLNQKTWLLNKVAALVPATSEVRADALGLVSHINTKAPSMIRFKVDEAIIRGTGAGMPVGILNSSGTISVSKESNQPNDTYKATNAQKQIMRMYPEYFRNATWLIHPDVVVNLHQLFVVAKTDAGTAIAAGGLVFNPQAQPGMPFGSLYSKPILYTQHCETVGDVGDVILADLSQYRAVTKSSGIESAVSPHFWFDQDIEAFRFIFRMGGGPKFDTTISPRDGSNTMAAFVTVAAR